MGKEDEDSQEYPVFLNEMREEMSAKGLTREELDEILNDVEKGTRFSQHTINNGIIHIDNWIMQSMLYHNI